MARGHQIGQWRPQNISTATENLLDGSSPEPSSRLLTRTASRNTDLRGSSVRCGHTHSQASWGRRHATRPAGRAHSLPGLLTKSISVGPNISLHPTPIPLRNFSLLPQLQPYTLYLYPNPAATLSFKVPEAVALPGNVPLSYCVPRALAVLCSGPPPAGSLDGLFTHRQVHYLQHNPLSPLPGCDWAKWTAYSAPQPRYPAQWVSSLLVK